MNMGTVSDLIATKKFMEDMKNPKFRKHHILEKYQKQCDFLVEDLLCDQETKDYFALLKKHGFNSDFVKE